MFNLIEEEIGNKSVTENGALGYESSKSTLVDLNYQVSSLRNATEDKIIRLFDKAFYENKEYCVKWLFYARDIREGLGERRLFRICYRRLVELDVDIFYKNLNIISEYGRWDDIISLIGISEVTDKRIITILNSQLIKDLNNLKEGKSISLLGKWMPSENASSRQTKELARKICKLMELTPRKYRLMLSKLRKYLNVVEVKMCSNQWENIDYSRVPSLANLKYKNAFLRHDEDRRREYLESVSKGISNFNMKVANPVDVVSRYTNSSFRNVNDYDETLELAWKNLKDVNISDTMVVADGSGSMTIPVSGKTTALDVAMALAIYNSEHNTGVYKDKYITFSYRPQFVDMSNDNNLREKIIHSRKHHECSNTNIEAVFDLILNIAINNNVSNEDMIKNVLIISDMEFDEAQNSYWFRDVSNPLTTTLFDEIKRKFDIVDYDLPKLIFWNVNSRTNTIPLIENELGVTLVSGFSQNVLKMVMSNKYNPYDVLVETITSKRYDLVKV